MNTQPTTRILREIIADRVRALRKAAGMTQEYLAERAGIGPEHLSKIETAVRLPSLETLVSLAAALGVQASDLLGRTDDGNRSGRADRLEVVLSTLHEEDADFIESEVLTWAARLHRLRG